MYYGKIERGNTDRERERHREREGEREEEREGEKEREREREGLNLCWKVLESQTETVRQRERDLKFV